MKFKPNAVVIGNEEKYPELKEALKNEDIKVFAGKEALAQVVTFGTVDVVVTATVGYSGLLPTVNAIRLNHFKTLIHHRSGINGHFGSHVPVRMPECLLRSHLFQFVVALPPERTSRSRQDGPDQIQPIVHPQSIVHSMVQFADGSIKAQLGVPDMRLPIQYALTYPDRVQSAFGRVDFTQYPSLTFEEPDRRTFRNLELAYESMLRGGNRTNIERLSTS